MPIINLFDRVKQKSTTAGSGNITFTSSVAAFVDFSGVYTDGDELYYAIENLTDFEVGIGTYSGNALSRDTVLKSSNSDNLLNLPGDANTFVYNTYAASGAVYTSGDRCVQNVGSINFNLGTTPAYSEGRIFYDSENHALSVYNDESEITLQVGQEQYLRVRNNTTGTIFNGEAVRIIGSQGTRPIIDKAIATNDIDAQAIGLATHDIEQNSFGYITTYGIVNNVDTSAFSSGQEIFLSYAISGGLTGVSPVAPNFKLSMGHVLRSHPNIGNILVKPSTPKLGGGDVKSLGNFQESGIAFIDLVAGSDAAIISSNTGLSYNSGTNTLQVDAGGVRFPDGATQTIAYTGQTADLSSYATISYVNTVSGNLESQIIGGATPTGVESGVAFFSTTNNELTGVSNFVYNQTLNQLGLNTDPQAGLHVKNDTSAYPVLTVEAGAGQALPLTRWINENGVVVAIVDYESGLITTSGGVTFPDGVTQTIAYTGQGGGTSYTAASGITLEGSTFTMSGTGTLSKLNFDSESVFINNLNNANIARSVVIGHEAGGASSNTDSVIIGHQAGSGSATSDQSVMIGELAGNDAGSSSLAVMIGWSAGVSASNNDESINIGLYAGGGATSSYNLIAIGTQAGWQTNQLDYGVNIGYQAGYQMGGTTNQYGNMIGYQAGYQSSGSYNNYIGYRAGRLAGNGTRNIEIVTQGATTSVIGANSNKLHIENTIIGDTSSKLIAIGNVTSANLTPDATLEVLPAASTDVGLIVQGAVSQSANLQEWQDSAGNTYSRVTSDGRFSNPTANNTEVFGDAAVGFTSGVNNIIVTDSGSVYNASTVNNRLTVVGSQATFNGSTDDFILVGSTASIGAGTNTGIVLGNSANIGANDDFTIVVGHDSNTDGTDDITIGHEVVNSSSSNSVKVGNRIQTGGNGHVLIGNDMIGATNAIGIGHGSYPGNNAVVIGNNETTSNGTIVIMANSQTGIYVDSIGNLTIRETGIFQGGVEFPDGLTQKNAWPAAVVEDATTSITLSCSSHANKHLRTTSASAVTITIPSGLGCDANSIFTFEQAGAGGVGISGAPGVTLNSFNSATGIEGQYAVAHLKQVTTDTYTLYGDIA